MKTLETIAKARATEMKLASLEDEIITNAKYMIFSATSVGTELPWWTYELFKLDWVHSASRLGDADHTESVWSLNSTSNHCGCEGLWSYTRFYSDSLIDAIAHCNKNYCLVNEVNNLESDYWGQISSFIRKNADALKAHEDCVKFEEMLATGCIERLKLVKALFFSTIDNDNKTNIEQ